MSTREENSKRARKSPDNRARSVANVRPLRKRAVVNFDVALGGFAGFSVRSRVRTRKDGRSSRACALQRVYEVSRPSRGPRTSDPGESTARRRTSLG